MRETWYVLMDGSFADPRDVVADEKGALRHKDGVYVAMRSHDAPHSRSMSDSDMAQARKARSGASAQKTAPSGAYKTRESKAE